MDAYIRKLLKKEQSEFWLVVVLTLLSIAVRVLVRSWRKIGVSIGATGFYSFKKADFVP